MSLTDKQIKALPDTRLTVKVMEESSEVIRAGAKLLQHGSLASDLATGMHYDNYRDICAEYEQVRALMIELIARHGNSYGVTMAQLAKERNDDH